MHIRAIHRTLPIIMTATVLALVPSASRAQLCRTSNCTSGAPPAACANRATPRTLVVHMTGLLAFSPSEPKIEPGECVEWTADVVTHSSTADPCPGGLCTSASPPTCLWESGDISSAGTPPSVICDYDPVAYPPLASDGFYCRFHDNALHTGTMHGNLHVTTEIQLLVNKDLLAGDVVLSWSGGGIPGDVTYKIERSDTGDPTFPTASLSTFDPDGGAGGVTMADKAELSYAFSRYYIVRNRQSNESLPTTCDPPDCNDLEPCTYDTCLDGVCSHDPAPDGTPCDIYNPYAICLSGVCTIP